MKNYGKAVMMMVGLALPLVAWPQAQSNNAPDLTRYLTPDAAYTRVGRSLARQYQPQLLGMIEQIGKEIKSDRFELMDVNRSPVGGVGLWTSPDSFEPGARFLGVMARVNIRLPYFPDSDGGRMTDAVDAFGMDLLRIMGQTLDQIQDPSIKGVELVLIYSKEALNDPAFLDHAEASAVFIPRDELRKFNSFQITLQTLFDRSHYYYFRGRESMPVLFKYLLRA